MAQAAEVVDEDRLPDARNIFAEKVQVAPEDRVGATAEVMNGTEKWNVDRGVHRQPLPEADRRMATPGISKPGKALPLKLASAKRSPGRSWANIAAVARRRLHDARVIPNVCDSK